MSVDLYVEAFWKNWQGKDEVEDSLAEAVSQSLRETFYALGLVKVKALEDIEGFITKDKVYTVKLVKDEFFPEGEECVEADSGDFITLPCFEREVVA